MTTTKNDKEREETMNVEQKKELITRKVDSKLSDELNSKEGMVDEQNNELIKSKGKMVSE